jgi:hypothetical protein
MSGIRGPLVGRYGRDRPVAVVLVMSLKGWRIPDCAPQRLHRLPHHILGLPLRWLCMVSSWLDRIQDPLKLKLSGHVHAARQRVVGLSTCR